MNGIRAIASYIPHERIDNVARAASLGSSPEQVRQRIGFVQNAVLGEGETTLSMATQALERLISSTGIARSDIGALLVVGQNNDRNIPHLSAELHGSVGLADTCACFDVGLGCSGYVYGLSILSAFMEANEVQVGVLVTADPYSKIVDRNDKDTALIFGDAATATLLTTSPVFSVGRFVFGTRGSEAEKLANKNGNLFMNGRAVFNFTATLVPANVRQMLEKNGLGMDDVDLFILHQGSRFIVETLADRLGAARDKVPFEAANYGNTVSSSIPLILERYLAAHTLRCIALCGFGVGLSWGSTVIKRIE